MALNTLKCNCVMKLGFKGLSLKVVEKPNKCKSFWALIFDVVE